MCSCFLHRIKTKTSKWFKLLYRWWEGPKFMFVTTPNLVVASNVIIVVFAFGAICDVACTSSVALASSVVNASNCVWWNNFPLHFILPFLFPNLVEFCDWWFSITTLALKFCNCYNPNIRFTIKCKVQGPMRSKVCLGVEHTFTNGGECKEWSPMIPKCILTLGITLMWELRMFRTLVGSVNKH